MKYATPEKAQLYLDKYLSSRKPKMIDTYTWETSKGSYTLDNYSNSSVLTTNFNFKSKADDFYFTVPLKESDFLTLMKILDK